MKTLDYIAPGPDTVGWKARHKRAVFRALPYDTTRWPFYGGLGYVVIRGLASWLDYAEEHAKRYESRIGDDYVLGPAWEQWGRALRTMLNGDMGELDCGTLDSIILDNLIEQGFTEE